MKQDKHPSITRLTNAGFMTIVIIMSGLAAYILVELKGVSALSSTVHELRSPTFQTSSKLKSNVILALSSLRGVLLLNDETQLNHFQTSWSNIHLSVEKLKHLSINWTNPENNEKLEVIDGLITQFAASQNEILHLSQNRISAHNNDPAFNGLAFGGPNFSEEEVEPQYLTLLRTVASPLGEEILSLLQEVVDDQHNSLQTDSEALDFLLNSLNTFIISAAAIAILFSLWLAITIIRHTKRIEDKSNQRHDIIDQNILICRLDLDANILGLSNHLCRELGGIQSSFIGTQSNFFLNEKDYSERVDEINNTIKTETPWVGEFERIGPNGESKWYRSTIIPQFDKFEQTNYFTNILENITDRKRNEHLSITDKLTGIYNRRHFDRVLKREIQVARRRQTFLTLAILDIDYFKPFNDNYGHPEGDKILRMVAQTVQKLLQRPDDYIFRVGGEEFAVLFTTSNIEQSQSFLEMLRENIEDQKIIHKYSDISSYLTVSIGASCAKGVNIPEAEEFYEISDNALYEAKITRNSVEIVGL